MGGLNILVLIAVITTATCNPTILPVSKGCNKVPVGTVPRAGVEHVKVPNKVINAGQGLTGGKNGISPVVGKSKLVSGVLKQKRDAVLVGKANPVSGTGVVVNKLVVNRNGNCKTPAVVKPIASACNKPILKPIPCKTPIRVIPKPILIKPVKPCLVRPKPIPVKPIPCEPIPVKPIPCEPIPVKPIPCEPIDKTPCKGKWPSEKADGPIDSSEQKPIDGGSGDYDGGAPADSEVPADSGEPADNVAPADEVSPDGGDGGDGGSSGDGGAPADDGAPADGSGSGEAVEPDGGSTGNGGAVPDGGATGDADDTGNGEVPGDDGGVTDAQFYR